MRLSILGISALMLTTAMPAFAQDAAAPPPMSSGVAPAQGDTSPPPVVTDAPATPFLHLTGGVTLISDYRFRGLTQTNEDAAIQSTATLATKPGFYVSYWTSTIDGSGRTPLLTGYGNSELDLSAGYTTTFSGVTVDGGLLYYVYARHVPGLKTDFFEPYASISYTLGPVSTKVGAAYAWGGQKGLDFRPNNSDDNIYVYGEAGIAIPKTPLSLKGHFGYTKGSLGLANLVASDDSYFDYSGSIEGNGGPFKVGVSYVGTDITNSGGFAQRFGRGKKVLGYVGFSF